MAKANEKLSLRNFFRNKTLRLVKRDLCKLRRRDKLHFFTSKVIYMESSMRSIGTCYRI